jgi:hypothetical protein
MSSIPTPGPIVSDFITTWSSTPGPEKTLVDNLAAYGTSRPANINGYHAAYEAALETALSSRLSSAIAGVFTFGAILDLTSSTNSPSSILESETYWASGSTSFDISLATNFPSTATNKSVGTYYKLSFPGGTAGTKYLVVLDSLDISGGLQVQDGDAVVIYDTGSYKRLDKIDNVQTSISGTEDVIEATQDANSSNYTLDLATAVKDKLALVDTTETVGDVRGSINATLINIMQRLQTITGFMNYVQSTATFLDSTGKPISFNTNTVSTTVNGENLETENSVVQYPNAVTFTSESLPSSNYYYGSTIIVSVTGVEVLLETLASVFVSVDGGATYVSMDSTVAGAYSKSVDVPYTTATSANKVFLKVTTSQLPLGYIIPNYASYNTLKVDLVQDAADRFGITGPNACSITGGSFRLTENDEMTTLLVSTFPTQIGVQDDLGNRQYFDVSAAGTVEVFMTGTAVTLAPAGTFVVGRVYSLFVSNGTAGTGAATATKFIVSSTITSLLGV